MPRLMDIGLERLSNLLQDMAKLSEECVNMAIDAYLKDRDAAKDLYEQSSKLLILNSEVNDLATELLIRYQPVASDLRYIRACLEASNGLSRFGRYAYDIAVVRSQIGELSHCDNSLIIKTSEHVKKMIHDSIKAFNERDIALARKVRESDDLVDALYKQNIRSMLEGNMDIRCAIASTLIMRYLERIADHAVYISDLVKYIVTGEKEYI
ncbi:MAG: PhoU family transcriptional regulator [Candidatus Nitrosocaldaceae archaeon]|nr:MAG: PhoU family transcriptional regulator [Candidatus Nitrosocaldaceae archaeon]